MENFIKISKRELSKHLNGGLTLSNIARLYNCSFYKIRKLIDQYKLKTINKKIVCLRCNKDFSCNVSRPAKYCSTKCRSAHWPKLYPQKFKEHQRRSRLKNNPIKCKFCKILIPDSKRKSGLVYCSDNCRKTSRQQKERRRKDNIFQRFADYKLSVGCSICGYRSCSRSLDFHHIEPTSKSCRISATLWESDSKLYKKEIQKCVLVCKNCHYEIHDRNTKKYKGLL